MQYDVNITYDRFRGYIGMGGDTLYKAHVHMHEMLDFYKEYIIEHAYIAAFCPDCERGQVRKCPCPKKHSNGYHAEKCYKVCKTCKGQYEIFHEDIIAKRNAA